MEWAGQRLLARVDDATKEIASSVDALQAMFLSHAALGRRGGGAPGRAAGVSHLPARHRERAMSWQHLHKRTWALFAALAPVLALFAALAPVLALFAYVAFSIGLAPVPVTVATVPRRKDHPDVPQDRPHPRRRHVRGGR